MNNKIIGAILGVVIIAGGSFYGGMTYAKSGTPVAGQPGAGAGFTRGAGGRGAGAGGGFTAGQILSNSGTSISIQQQNGSSSEIVLISPTTQILKSATGTASDLTVGTDVTITGTSNSDGSLSATAIQIRPAGMGFPGGRTGATQTQ